MRNYLRSYVIATGGMAVFALLLVALLESIVSVGPWGLGGMDIAFLAIGVTALLLLWASARHSGVLLLAATAMILTVGIGFALIDGTDILLSGFMLLLVSLLGYGVQQRYPGARPWLPLAAASLLSSLSGIVLLPFFLDTGRTALDAAALSLGGLLLGLVLSSPATWQQSTA